MKKCFYIIIVLIAQNIIAQDVKFGIKAGATYSDPSVVNAKASATLSYFAGAQLELKFSKFAIQPEVQYGVLKANFNGNFVKNKTEVGYISIPVVAKIYFLKKFSFDFGPQIGFKLNKKTETSLSGVPLGDILEISNFDYAALAGITFNITDNLFIQGRGIYGFERLTGKTNNVFIDPVLASFEVKNRVVQLGIGYNF